MCLRALLHLHVPSGTDVPSGTSSSACRGLKTASALSTGQEAADSALRELAASPRSQQV